MFHLYDTSLRRCAAIAKIGAHFNGIGHGAFADDHIVVSHFQTSCDLVAMIGSEINIFSHLLSALKPGAYPASVAMIAPVAMWLTRERARKRRRRMETSGATSEQPFAAVIGSLFKTQAEGHVR